MTKLAMVWLRGRQRIFDYAANRVFCFWEDEGVKTIASYKRNENKRPGQGRKERENTKVRKREKYT